MSSHPSQTHRALLSILAHCGLVGLGKLWGVVVHIQNFDVDLDDGFFARGVPCRGKGLVTATGSADVWMGSPGGGPSHRKRGPWKREAREGILDEMSGRGGGRGKLHAQGRFLKNYM